MQNERFFVILKCMRFWFLACGWASKFSLVCKQAQFKKTINFIRISASWSWKKYDQTDFIFWNSQNTITALILFCRFAHYQYTFFVRTIVQETRGSRKKHLCRAHNLATALQINSQWSLSAVSVGSPFHRIRIALRLYENFTKTLQRLRCELFAVESQSKWPKGESGIRNTD